MKKVLNTVTEILRTSTTLSIFTYYVEGVLIRFKIKDDVDSVDGVDFLENELEYFQRGYEDIKFFMNSRGELMVDNKSPEYSFFIDDDGYLQMSDE